MTTCPSALLELVFGWLQLHEIRAAKLVCAHWSTCQGDCPTVHGFPNPALVQPGRIQVLHLEVTSEDADLDRQQFRNLARVYLKLDASRVFPRTLHRRTLESTFADLLHHVEWTFEPPQAGILTKLLHLPQLRSLVLHRARYIYRSTASQNSPLESLIFVDCCDVDLAFLADLPRLESLGFRRGTVFPGLVPPSVQSRITELEVTRNTLFMSQRYIAVDLTRFPRLRRLRLAAQQGAADFLMEIMEAALQGLVYLRHLDFRVTRYAARLMASLVNLTTLDIEFAAWPSPDRGFASCSTLRHLVLRGVPANSDKLVERQLFTTHFCAELQRLKLVGPTPPCRLLTGSLPGWIQCLELAGLWPSSTVSIPEVWLEAESFALMPQDKQQLMQSCVKNLYVVQKIHEGS